MTQNYLTKLGFNLFDYTTKTLETSPKENCFEQGKELITDKGGHILSGIFQYKNNKFLFCVFYSGKIYFCVSDPSILSVTKGIIEICNNLKYDEKPDRLILNKLIICIIKNYEKTDVSGLYY